MIAVVCVPAMFLPKVYYEFKRIDEEERTAQPSSENTDTPSDDNNNKYQPINEEDPDANEAVTGTQYNEDEGTPPGPGIEIDVFSTDGKDDTVCGMKPAP